MMILSKVWESPPLSIDQKIKMLYQLLRYLSRKDHYTNDAKKSTKETIEAVQIELDYWKSQKENNTLSKGISADDIWEKYWYLRNEKGIKEEPAYNEIEDWLLNRLDFSREEIKQKFNITLTQDNFTRSARNQPQRF